VPHDLTISFVGRLVLAAVLGAAVGLERELQHKPAGLRTNLLICFGSALFTIISYTMAGSFTGDHTRIAAQIIPGIGFIGAGVVLRERGAILGITSASTIFVVASIGMAAGAGMILTAVFGAFLCLGALIFIGSLENRFGIHTHLMAFHLVAPAGREFVNRAHQFIIETGVEPRSWTARSTPEETTLEFEADVTSPQERQILTHFTQAGVRCDAHPLH
jgi:putative Mg2+ transporter-C (MgtC) family protein